MFWVRNNISENGFSVLYTSPVWAGITSAYAVNRRSTTVQVGNAGLMNSKRDKNRYMWAT